MRTYQQFFAERVDLVQTDCAINCAVVHRGGPYRTVVAETDTLIFRGSPWRVGDRSRSPGQKVMGSNPVGHTPATIYAGSL